MTHPASPRNERLSSSLLPFRVLYVPAYRIEWVPSTPLWPRHFWWTLRFFRRDRSPPSFKESGIILSRASLSFRDSSIVTCRPCRVAIVLPRLATSLVQRLPWGLVPLRDVSNRSPRPTGFPNPTFGPSSTFLTSSTVYSSCYLAGLFHPTTASRVSLQGFPPTSQERRLVAVASLLTVGTELLPGCPGASSRCVDLEGLF
jgi:hypothetical protein